MNASDNTFVGQIEREQIYTDNKFIKNYGKDGQINDLG